MIYAGELDGPDTIEEVMQHMLDRAVEQRKCRNKEHPHRGGPPSSKGATLELECMENLPPQG